MMRQFVIAAAALAALGIAMPLAANADTVVIHKHRDAFPPPPVMFHHDHDKTIIIKHHNDD